MAGGNVTTETPNVEKHSPLTHPHSFPSRARNEHETKPKSISRLGVSCVDSFPSISDQAQTQSAQKSLEIPIGPGISNNRGGSSAVRLFSSFMVVPIFSATVMAGWSLTSIPTSLAPVDLQLVAVNWPIQWRRCHTCDKNTSSHSGGRVFN